MQKKACLHSISAFEEIMWVSCPVTTTTLETRALTIKCFFLLGSPRHKGIQWGVSGALDAKSHRFPVQEPWGVRTSHYFPKTTFSFFFFNLLFKLPK